jgi:Response receiver domain
MSDPQYEAAIQDSFIKKPLRSVLLIDDDFPTYSDLCSADKAHSQKDRACNLYGGFRQLDMLCDIENMVDEVEADRLRKSDLIVLDYHLIPNSEDNKKAIQLLRQLAISHHFNTVVVYTAASEQDDVWLDVIASLSGGWSAITASLDGEPKQHWENLSDANKLPTPTKDAVMQFARRGVRGAIDGDTLKLAVDELVSLGVPAAHCSKIVEYLVAEDLAKRAGEFAAQPSGHAVGDYAHGKRWLQVGNAFVVIMKKIDGTDTVSETEAIMATLKDALLAWRPNVVQILISEIQNALELEGLAGSDTLLRKPDMQAALTYNLLKEIGAVDLSQDVSIRIPVMSLVDKVVDSIRRRLSTHEELLVQFEKAVVGDLKSTGWTIDKWPKDGKLVSAATELARTPDVKSTAIIFRLNHFLSTEKFRRAHLSTGTVFYHRDKDEYFIAASPACDLVAGQSKPLQLWATAISPTLPMIAIRLYPADNLAKALSVASHADHVFLEIGDEPKAFKVISGAGHQPSYEMIFVSDEGRVRTEDGKIVFDGSRIVLGAVNQTEAASETTPTTPEPAAQEPKKQESIAVDSPASASENRVSNATQAPENIQQTDETQVNPILEFATFEIIEQLRGVNATHLLQLIGQHLSRVGLDFVNAPGG